MQKIETDSLWVAGDFNIALKQTDIIAGSPHPEREVATFIKTLANFDIYDIWRINHSESKDYAWSRPTPFTARRINYIFCDSVSLTKKYYNNHRVSLTLRPQTRKSASKHEQV